MNLNGNFVQQQQQKHLHAVIFQLAYYKPLAFMYDSRRIIGAIPPTSVCGLGTSIAS